MTVAHPKLLGREACPRCSSGKLYAQGEPAKLVRITGLAPLSATVYSCDRLRCNLCGEVGVSGFLCDAGRLGVTGVSDLS